MEIVEQSKQEPSTEIGKKVPVPINEIEQKSKRRPEKTKHSKKEKQILEVSKPDGENNHSAESTDKRKRNKRLKIENRASLQEMVDYKNTQVRFYDLRMNPFSRFTVISDNFKIIAFDGQPVKHMVLCTVCNVVLLRDKKTSINLLRHLKRHGISIVTKKMQKKNEKTTTQLEPALPEKPDSIENNEQNAPRLNLILDDS